MKKKDTAVAIAKKEWLTNEEAGELLNRSPRTVQALGSQGQLDRKPGVTENGRTTYLVSRASVELYKQGATPPRIPPTRAPQLAQATAAAPAIPEIAEALAGAAQASAVKLEPHVWLTLDEAAAYARLPGAYLARMIRLGELPARDTHMRGPGKWRVQVSDVERITASTGSAWGKGAS